MNDTANDDQFGDPAKAFDDLRAEVYVLRRAMEGLQDGLKKDPAPHYAAHLKEHTAQLTKVGDALRHIKEQIDGIQKFPKDAVSSIISAGNSMFERARSDAAHSSRVMRHNESTLFNLIGVVQAREQQKKMLIWTGVGAFAVGLIFFLVIGRALPFGMNSYLAAGVMGQTRWEAGQELMGAANPEGWKLLTADASLTNANREKVDACRAAAVKSKKDQQCTIVVSSP